MPRSQRELIAEPTEKAQPTAVVRSPGGRVVALDLGAENELPPLLVQAGWIIIKDLRKQHG